MNFRESEGITIEIGTFWYGITPRDLRLYECSFKDESQCGSELKQFMSSWKSAKDNYHNTTECLEHFDSTMCKFSFHKKFYSYFSGPKFSLRALKLCVKNNFESVLNCKPKDVM